VSVTAPQEGADRSVRLAGAAPAVTVDHLSKRFVLPHQQYSTFKERALHPFRGRTFDALHAVDDVSFTVAEGEFFGIVGRNGSGKSTLLKCLAGIYEADGGHTAVRGRLSPFIELGVGFNPDLTARDNIVINAIMLGLTRRQARERFDDIIAFAELEEFLDLKLKNYSSGMSVRLAFSVAIQVDADVLLVDEVLAVGDAAFQQKCFEQFDRLKDAGKTIVFVTHDMSAVERFCDRAILLERGKLLSLDEPHAIARAYNELNFGRIVKDTGEANERFGDHEAAEIKAAWFESAAGERVSALAQGEPMRMCVEVAFHAPVEHPLFALHLRNEARHTIFATSTDLHEGPTGSFAAGDTITVRAALDNWLAPGRYELTPTVARQGGGADVLDLREDLATLMVHGTRHSGGIVEIPHTLSLERS
jgi:ABC-type polysaccharide/polyol phosphate transport system ATPase subunit